MRSRVTDIRRTGEHTATITIAVDGSADADAVAALDRLLAQVRPGREVQLGGVVMQDSARGEAQELRSEQVGNTPTVAECPDEG